MVARGRQNVGLRFRQNILALGGAGAKATVIPNGGSGGVSVLAELSLGLGGLGTGTLDLTDNDLALQATAATKDAVLAETVDWIMSGWGGVDANFVTEWDGNGIVSSAARTANVAAGFDLTGLGAIRNSDLDITVGLPGSAYTSFGGQPVELDWILVKYTYTGDANLDGSITFDDWAAMDAAYFDTIPDLGWATGDVNYDGVTNFDDYAVVDQANLYQGDPL
jgi:hypothetical protein